MKEIRFNENPFWLIARWISKEYPLRTSLMCLYNLYAFLLSLLYRWNAINLGRGHYSDVDSHIVCGICFGTLTFVFFFIIEKPFEKLSKMVISIKIMAIFSIFNGRVLHNFPLILDFGENWFPLFWKSPFHSKSLIFNVMI